MQCPSLGCPVSLKYLLPHSQDNPMQMNWAQLAQPLVNILKPELGMVYLLSKKSVKGDKMNSAWKAPTPFKWPQRGLWVSCPLKLRGHYLLRFLMWISQVRWHIQCSLLCNCTWITAQISPGYPEWFLPNVTSNVILEWPLGPTFIDCDHNKHFWDVPQELQRKSSLERNIPLSQPVWGRKCWNTVLPCNHESPQC